MKDLDYNFLGKKRHYLHIIYIAVIFILSCNSSSQNQLELGDDEHDSSFKKWMIYGKVQHIDLESEISLYKVEGESKNWVKSIKIKPTGRFYIEVKTNQPTIFSINFYKKQEFLLLVNDEDVELVVEGKKNGFFEIQSSQENDHFYNFLSFKKKIQLHKGHLESRGTYLKRKQSLDEEIKKFVENSFPAYASVLAAQLLPPTEHNDFLEKWIGKFMQTHSSSGLVHNLEKELELTHNAQLGEIAPKPNYIFTNDSLFNISNLDSQFVLLHFWASWCGKCREDHKELRYIQNMYQPDTFQIISFSIDQSQWAWKNGIAKDQMSWTHLLDTNRWESECLNAYNVQAIPAYFLLKEGEILERELTLSQIKEKLEELLSNQEEEDQPSM